MEWFKRFWQDHGDRIIFLGSAFVIAIVLYFASEDMQGEAKAVIVGVMMLLYNKARGTIANNKNGTIDDTNHKEINNEK